MSVKLVVFSVLISWAKAQSTQVTGTQLSVRGDVRPVRLVTERLELLREVDGSAWEHEHEDVVSFGSASDGSVWIVTITKENNFGNAIFRGRNGLWEKVDGQLVQVSARSYNEALGVNSEGNIWHFKEKKWNQLPGAATWAGIGVDGAMWVINSQQQIFRWNVATNQWDKIEGAAVNLDVYSASRIVVTNKDNQVFTWTGTSWKKLGAKCIQASITENSIFCINKRDNRFVIIDWTTPQSNQTTPAQISVRGNIMPVCIVNERHQLLRDSGDGAWEREHEDVLSFGSASDRSVWIVTTTKENNFGNAVFRGLDGIYEKVDGQLVQVSARSYNEALGVNSEGNIWHFKEKKWNQLPGAATWAGIGVDGAMWVINSQQQIFRWNAATNQWDRIEGAAVNLDVYSASRIVVTNKDNQVFTWTGTSWKKLGGKCIQASITENSIFCINKSDNKIVKIV